MSRCSLVIMYASLKNMVSRKTRLKSARQNPEVEHDPLIKLSYTNN